MYFSFEKVYSVYDGEHVLGDEMSSGEEDKKEEVKIFSSCISLGVRSKTPFQLVPQCGC